MAPSSVEQFKNCVIAPRATSYPAYSRKLVLFDDIPHTYSWNDSSFYTKPTSGTCQLLWAHTPSGMNPHTKLTKCTCKAHRGSQLAFQISGRSLWGVDLVLGVLLGSLSRTVWDSSAILPTVVSRKEAKVHSQSHMAPSMPFRSLYLPKLCE